jgi:2-oxoglutarate dehydrogenase E1 component
VPVKKLRALSQQLTTLPAGFKLHSRVEKVIADRRAMGRANCHWTGAWARRLPTQRCSTKGTECAFPAKTSVRGTFSHRHAVLHDQNREKWDDGTFVPLQHVSPKQASFEIIDSVLTEQAVVGFEYGYSTSDPTRLVIWEAQFGDFVMARR